MVQINLIGDAIKSKKKSSLGFGDLGEGMEKLKELMHVTTIISILAIILPPKYVDFTIKTKRQEFQEALAKQDKEISSLKQEERELAADISQIDSLTKQIEMYRTKVSAVERLVSTRTYPVPVLDSISQVIPKYVWLTELNFNLGKGGGQLSLAGNAITNDVLSDFIAALQEIPHFSNVMLEESVHQSEKDYDFKKFRLNLNTKEVLQ